MRVSVPSLRMRSSSRSSRNRRSVGGKNEKIARAEVILDLQAADRCAPAGANAKDRHCP